MGSEDDLVKVEFDPDQGILAAFAPGPWPAAAASASAEEGLEDVAEVSEVAVETGVAARSTVAAVVVVVPLFRVAQHVVGVRDMLEPLRRVCAGVHVGVELAGEAAVCLLDFVCGGIAGDAEYFVMVSQSWLS